MKTCTIYKSELTGNAAQNEAYGEQKLRDAGFDLDRDITVSYFEDRTEYYQKPPTSTFS